MAYVQKKGDRWQARFRDATGREHAKRFDRRADAERWLRDQAGAVDKGQWIDPSLGRLHFDEWCARWWASTPALRASTRARDASYLRTHILPAFGAQPLASIDHMAVTSWVADLSASGKAPATVQKAAQILSKIMQSAVDARMIPASPCAKVKLPRVERNEMRFLDPQEVARLADAIHPRYRALVYVGAWSGLRIGELAGLKRARVDQMRRVIHVAEIVTEVQGHLHWGRQRRGRGGARSPCRRRSWPS